MKAENKAFLVSMKPFHEKMRFGGTIHLNLTDKRKILDIIREEWDKTYTTCITCIEGVYDLLKMAFNNLAIEEQKEAQATVSEPTKPKKNAPSPPGKR